jgi:hypothetical protein
MTCGFEGHRRGSSFRGLTLLADDRAAECQLPRRFQPLVPGSLFHDG